MYEGIRYLLRKHPRAVLTLYYSSLNDDISYEKYLLILSKILGNTLHSTYYSLFCSNSGPYTKEFVLQECPCISMKARNFSLYYSFSAFASSLRAVTSG